jgi:hypothetical protein
MRCQVHIVLLIGTALILIAAALYHTAEHRRSQAAGDVTYEQSVGQTG